METPQEVRNLVDQLGRALSQAIESDETGQKLIQQIQEIGFEVGLILQAMVCLRPINLDDPDYPDGHPLKNIHYPGNIPETEDSKELEWSEEDKALMCNFRISLD